MVVAQPVAALEQYIRAGHAVSITYGSSATPGKIKIKARVGPVAEVLPAPARSLLMAALVPLRGCLQHVVVDRGHHFSAGNSEVSFWVSLAPTAGAKDSGPCLATAGPVSPSAPDDWTTGTRTRIRSSDRRSARTESSSAACSPPTSVISVAAHLPTATPPALSGCEAVSAVARQSPKRSALARREARNAEDLVSSRVDGQASQITLIQRPVVASFGSDWRRAEAAHDSHSGFVQTSRGLYQLNRSVSAGRRSNVDQCKHMSAPSTTESGMPIKQLSKCLPAQAFSLPWMSSSPTTSFDVLIADSNPPASRAL